MKYLNKRNDFLSSKRMVLENVSRTSTQSGPFGNDLGWHDSLLGRYMNHLVRKSQIARRANKISDLTSRLEETFDALVAQNAMISIDDNSLELIKKIELYHYFWELKEGVDNQEEIETLRILTNEAIDNMDSEEAILKLGDFPEREGLLDELNNLKKFLDSLEKKEEPKKEINLDETMLKNLNSLLGLMKSFTIENKETKKKEVFDRSKIEVNKFYLRRNEKGGVLLLRVESLDDDKLKDGYLLGRFYDVKSKKWMTTPTAVKIDSIFREVGTIGDKIKTQDFRGIKSLSNLVDIKVPELVKNVDINESVDNKEDISKANSKLKSSINLLTNNKNEFSITRQTIIDLINNFKSGDEKAKFIVYNLYKEIFSCIRGNKVKTTANPEPLFESYEELTKNMAKIPIMGVLIAKLSKRTNQFEENELYKRVNNGSTIHEFNTTLKDILDSNIGEPTYDTKPKEVKEGLLSYKKFILIKEADDTEANIEAKTNFTTVRDFFDKNCVGVKSFVVDKSEIDKVNKNLDKINKQKEKEGQFTIDGMDPVIEVVKLFNKAYKLFTFSYITKRTGASGGVGPSTNAKYTAFGGASDDGRQGPYRNNQIFDIWESAVNDIFKNRKYQHIFLPGTRLRIPKVANPSKKEDYEYIEKAGSNLRKFMLDILDGENLYKTQSSSGKQKEFINKYFGDVDDRFRDEFDYKGDEKSKKLQKEVSEIDTTNLKFVNAKTIDTKFKDIKEGCFFALKGKKGDTDVQRHFMISRISNEYVYLAMANTFGRFRSYLMKLDGKRTLENGDFKSLSLQSTGVSYTKIRLTDFELLLNVGKVDIKSVNNNRELFDDIITIDDSYWLVTSKDQKKYKVNDIKQLSSIIEQSNDVSGVVSLLKNSEGSKITKSK